MGAGCRLFRQAQAVSRTGPSYYSTGELRNLIAALHTLNNPKVIDATPVARSTGLHKGKRVVYAAHHIVNVKIGERKSYDSLFRYPVERSSPRRHWVRAHFVHFGIDKNCDHKWPAVGHAAPSGAPTWTCERCGGKRTWREAFERGDAGRGYVTKDNRLT